MANGISIHIGLNSVDPAQYAGWDGKLAACEFDAKDMQALADKQGYKTTLLLTKDATSARVIEAISAAAQTLNLAINFFLPILGMAANCQTKTAMSQMTLMRPGCCMTARLWMTSYTRFGASSKKACLF